MRDPKRIQRILDKLKEIWMNSPDQRFGQLTYNIFSQLPGTRKRGQTELDMFHVEDEDFEESLDSRIKIARSQKEK